MALASDMSTRSSRKYRRTDVSTMLPWGSPQVESLNIYHALLGDKTAQEVVHQTQIPYLSLIPSHINLTGAEVEMVNMIAASRAYEATVAAIQNYRRMAERAMEIGRV